MTLKTIIDKTPIPVSAAAGAGGAGLASSSGVTTGLASRLERLNLRGADPDTLSGALQPGNLFDYAGFGLAFGYGLKKSKIGLAVGQVVAGIPEVLYWTTQKAYDAGYDIGNLMMDEGKDFMGVALAWGIGWGLAKFGEYRSRVVQEQK